MKKFASLVLAMVMICGVCVNTAVAAGDDQDVTIIIDSYDSSVKIYGFTVTWDNTAFEYDEGSEGTWDPESHTHQSSVDASWTRPTLNVTVTNDSNDAVTYKAVCTDVEDDGITVVASATGGGNLTTGISLEAWANSGTDHQGKFTVTASGTPEDAVQNNAKVANVKVTIEHS